MQVKPTAPLALGFSTTEDNDADEGNVEGEKATSDGVKGLSHVLEYQEHMFRTRVLMVRNMQLLRSRRWLP